MKKDTKTKPVKKPGAKTKPQTKKDFECCISDKCSDNCPSLTYFLGFVGALIYYISTATGFWVGVLGILKAIVWPAILVFELMKFIGM